MPGLANLAGRIEGSAASPVTGAIVAVSRVGSRQRVRLTEAVDGQYGVEGLAPGKYEVRLSNRGFLSDSYRRELRPGRNSLGLVMGRRVNGTTWPLD